jgi:predicted RNA binding protein YcfA (HicA-like mRNA interferase family)
VISFLEQNGFFLDHTSGSHFIFYHPSSRRRAVVPSHNRDLPKGTLISLLREAGFTREELIDFLAGR